MLMQSAVGRCLRAALMASVVVACLALAPQAFAADSPLELDEVVVTGERAEAPLAAVPRSLSVISATEIARSTATTLVDLLRQEANLNLQSFVGSDKFAAIDIRGMGATAASNVLVLVDGVRLNADDLSGADFSTLPLSQVERIEIARGGQGVRYGNGAVGGVINIITRPARSGAPKARMIARRSAFDTDDLRLHASASHGIAALGLDLSSLDTDGFRHNEFLNRRAGAASLRLEPHAQVQLTLRAAHHEDRYGLPGPLPAAVLDATTRARRQTNSPLDRGWTEDDRYSVQVRLDGQQYGETTVRGTYRDRGNPFYIGFNPVGTRADQLNRIDSYARTAEIEHRLPFSFAGQDHELLLGAALNDADYLRRENGAAVPGSSFRRAGRVHDRGYFALLNAAAPFDLRFTLGYRHDVFKSAQNDRTLRRACDIVFVPRTIFIESPFGGPPIPIVQQVPVERNCVTAFALNEERSGTAHSDAYNAGLTWQPRDWLTLYVNVDRNFRNPNLDEFLQASATLGRQRGRGYDAGVRLRPSARVEFSLAGFMQDIEDEIFYGLDAQGQTLNFNLDGTTRRRGGEAELRVWPLDSLALRASVGYVRPRLDGADLPLVPRVTLNAGGEWSMTDWADLALSVSHVGRRSDGNDSERSPYPRLPAYTLCNLRVRVHRGRYEAFAGINNLFNEIYSTIAYSNTVYPMPERHAYAGVRIDFL